jgi:hypothetical protein
VRSVPLKMKGKPLESVRGARERRESGSEPGQETCLGSARARRVQEFDCVKELRIECFLAGLVPTWRR